MPSIENDKKITHFYLKARGFLDWLNRTRGDLDDARKRADIIDVERQTYFLLCLMASLYDCIDAMAGLQKKPDWRRSLDDTRNSDPLLYFLRWARNVDVHDVVKHSHAASGYAEFFLLDADRARSVVSVEDTSIAPEELLRRCVIAAFGVPSWTGVEKVLSAGNRPSDEVLANFSVGMRTEGLAPVFRSFRLSRGSVVAEPTTHLGKPIQPLVHRAIGYAQDFYSAKLEELWIAQMTVSRIG